MIALKQHNRNKMQLEVGMEFCPSFALVLQVYIENKYCVAMVTAFSQVHPV